jgi:hypothetical protein
MSRNVLSDFLSLEADWVQQQAALKDHHMMPTWSAWLRLAGKIND